MRRLALFLLMLVASIAVPREALPQSPEVRASLDRLWRARHDPPAALSALRDSLFRPTSEAYRLATLLVESAANLGGTAAAERQLGFFTQSHDHWPWAWIFLADARARLAATPRISKAGLLQPEGASWAEGAYAAASRALALDSLSIPAAEVLVELLHTPGFHADTAAVFATLLRITDRPGQLQPSLLLGRFELEAAHGVTNDAEVTFRRLIGQVGDRSAIRLTIAPVVLAGARQSLIADSLDFAGHLLANYLEAGGDSAIYCFERSALLFAEERNDSASAAYYRGAGMAGDSMARALYRNDLALIADSTELARYDSLLADSLAPWLEYFWVSRDARAGQPLGTRLAEHRRRVLYALRHYSRPWGTRLQSWRWNTAPSKIAPLTEQPRSLPEEETTPATLLAETMRIGSATDRPGVVFDDRGLAYIRQGEPDRKAQQTGVDAALFFESWLYRRPQAPLVLHFLTPTINPPDFRLVPYALGDLMEECQLDAWYCVKAGKLSTRSLTERDLWKEHERELARIHRARTTDEDPLPFPRNLKAAYRVYRLPPARGSGTLLLIAASADPRGEDSIPVSLVYRVSATYPDTRNVIQLDTTLSTPPGKNHTSTALLAYRLPAGPARMTLAMVDSADSSSALGVEDSLDLPDFAAPAPVLSDLLVGISDSRVRWRYGNTELPLSPGQTFRHGATLAVAYAVRGFSGNVRTTIEMRRGNKARTSVTFTEPLEPNQLLVQRRIGLGKLGWGNYTLRVSLTELATGRELSRETKIVVE